MRLIVPVAAVVAVTGLLAQQNALAAGVVITSIDCAPADHPPGAFDVIYINNTGAAPQDLAGWQLTSDPEAGQRMPLDIAAVLDPGERLIIVAGRHGQAFPADNIFLWSPIEVLRDSGEPADYARLLDAAGAQASFAACPASAPEPTPTPAAAASSDQQSEPNPSVAQNASAPSGSRLPGSGGPPSARRDSGSFAVIAGWMALVSGAILIVVAKPGGGNARQPGGGSREDRHA